MTETKTERVKPDDQSEVTDCSDNTAKQVLSDAAIDAQISGQTNANKVDSKIATQELTDRGQLPLVQLVVGNSTEVDKIDYSAGRKESPADRVREGFEAVRYTPEYLREIKRAGDEIKERDTLGTTPENREALRKHVRNESWSQFLSDVGHDLFKQKIPIQSSAGLLDGKYNEKTKEYTPPRCYDSSAPFTYLAVNVLKHPKYPVSPTNPNVRILTPIDKIPTMVPLQ